MKYPEAKRLPQTRAGLAELVDQHHSIWSSKYVHDEFRDWCCQERSDDLATKLKYEFVLGDPNNNFLQISIRDDDKGKICRDVLARSGPVTECERE